MPADAVGNTRNDMYLASEAIRFLMKDKANDLSSDEIKTLNAYKVSLDRATKFIPIWVKVAVAIALGLGTMVGWKRIVVTITVGEKNRQDAFDVRARRLRRNHCRSDHRCGGRLWLAGFDNARAIFRHRRHHGGEWFRVAALDSA
jgi:hypothetical protein